jgi:hypothetical protein
MEIIILVCVAIIAYKVGWLAREYHAIKMIEQCVTHLKVEESRENIIPVTIEKVDNMFFVYNGEDKTFMAQGKDRKSLEAALEERFPGKIFAANSSNLKEVGL